MNVNNFTIKAQEAISAAQQLAFNNNNSTIETGHILKALLNDDDSAIDFLLKKNNVTMNLLESRLDENISKLPKVTGGAAPAQAIGRDANNMMLRAPNTLKQFGDEFV